MTLKEVNTALFKMSARGRVRELVSGRFSVYHNPNVSNNKGVFDTLKEAFEVAKKV
jgi:hypothetical protein